MQPRQTYSKNGLYFKVMVVYGWRVGLRVVLAHGDKDIIAFVRDDDTITFVRLLLIMVGESDSYLTEAAPPEWCLQPWKARSSFIRFCIRKYEPLYGEALYKTLITAISEELMDKLKFVAKGEPKGKLTFRMPIPEAMISMEIKESDAYLNYLAKYPNAQSGAPTFWKGSR
ncbi:hypothetical protein Tco_0856238 [Tanacetum coccineum]